MGAGRLMSWDWQEFVGTLSIGVQITTYTPCNRICVIIKHVVAMMRFKCISAKPVWFNIV